MFQQLLLATDGSESARQAADAALHLAALTRAHLTVLSVEETLPRYVSVAEEHRRERQEAFRYFDRIHSSLRVRAEAQQIPFTSAILSGHEVQSILRYASEHACDLLILGAQGHSEIWQAFLGSTADKLIYHAPCSVLIVRSRAAQVHWRECLIAFDGSPYSWRALLEGFTLATLLKIPTRVMSVGEGSSEQPPPVTGSLSLDGGNQSGDPGWSEYFQAIQQRAVRQAQQRGLSIKTEMLSGHASSTLIQATQAHPYALLLLGSTGHEHPWSSTLGSTARKVANEAACSLLLVRPQQTRHLVRDIMQTDVVAASEQTPMSLIVKHLVEEGTRLVVVIDHEHHVQGVITLSAVLAYNNTFQQLDPRQSADPAQLSAMLRKLFQNTSVASEVMNRNPFLLRETATLEEAARWIEARHLTRLPVVDEQRKLLGLFDQADLLRFYLDLPAESVRVPAQVAAGTGPARVVGDASLVPVPLVAEQLPLSDVLTAVQQASHRRVIVVDLQGVARGVIAERDLLAAGGVTTRRNPLVELTHSFAWTIPQEWLLHHASTGPLVARQVMRPKLFAVTPSTLLTTALRLMLEQHITRLVVIDEQGKPLGLIDRQHLLRALLERGG